MGPTKFSAKEVNALYQEYKQYCKDNHLRCSNSCALWDSIDKDCDVFGTYKPTIAGCGVYFDKWKEERNEHS